ncbi:alpha-glucosidase [Sphingorhabdus contaminans]|uniref:Alpha-glucosidase n=1 Tax=Sphingorhabdus contaminans TaxID=1343899 RepID=A0A553WDH2_9SPHN|nr:alpha-glucosidase [Sphingorhabdus contaminans]
MHADGFDLFAGDICVLTHRTHSPAFAIGTGTPDMEMVRGNFRIDDNLDLRLPLDCFANDKGAIRLWSSERPDAILGIRVDRDARKLALRIRCTDESINRLWVDMLCAEDEAFWGGGEQMSYLRLNGRRFPFWTSEPGVGRDKSTKLTQIMDAEGLAGGDYWTTNYPQPTWLSSRNYAVHLETAAYSVLDLTDGTRAGIECWKADVDLELFTANDRTGLVGQMSDRFGRQPPLPDWAISGAIVGLKDGQDTFERFEKIAASGAALTGLWCEDWIGIRQTGFGKRLFWDWQWNAKRYPDLPDRIAALAKRGVRFLGYVNPYLAVDGPLFTEAASLGYLALRQDSDEPYAVDFGEFDAGVVDFTNPEAAAWFSERIIGQEMLDFGLSGWMADFGEYLPTDVRLFDGSDPMEAHNRWPVLWAKVNADAIASRGKTGDATFFMRAGFSGVQAYCPLLWAGDQCVDFSRHDGINTVLTGALSSGLLGNAYHHSDLGGYTSLHGVVRSADLMHRWIDMAAFAPVMRSHEGNRPADNLQLDSNAEFLAHFARMSQVHARLAPYVRALSDEAVATGLPLQRPLFLHYDDPAYYDVQDQYLYGADMLVAPVVEADRTERNVILPEGEWVHLWSGTHYAQGTHAIAAPYGEPPVFTRKDSPFAPLFASVKEELGA